MSSPSLEILQHTLDLPSGRSIESRDGDRGGELVTIRSPSGRVELEVLLTDAGPVLRFDAAELELRATGRIRAECGTFEIAASDGIIQRTGGDLEQAAQGDARLTAAGDLTTRARTTTVTSTRGDVHLKANDDVRLTGERVMLNC